MIRTLLLCFVAACLYPVATNAQSDTSAVVASAQTDVLAKPAPAAADTASKVSDETLSTLTVPLTEALERVVSEVPTRMIRLRGELLANNPEAVDYVSRLLIPGVDNCVISVFNTPGDTTACWKVEFPAVEDFGKAQKMYHSLYESLKTAHLTRLHPGMVYRLDAPYLEASETKLNNSIEFTMGPDSPEDFKKIRVQILLAYAMPDWQLSMQVYEKPGELGMTKNDE
jgi:hypothetical protein